MMYLAWAALYEGVTDQAYFEVLIPRLLQEIALADSIIDVVIPATPAVLLGTRGRAVVEVASEICESADAFHIVFIHADTGGRGLEANLHSRSEAYCEAAHALCEWASERCICLTPRHETEAWALADPRAVTSALGYMGTPQSIGLPSGAAAAERLVDPKATLVEIASGLQGRARLQSSQLLGAIARDQRIEELRRARSFQLFEGALREALRSLGCLPQEA